MIHKKYRIITLLLICILLSNFIFEYKAQAEAIAISAGFALFLKACYAAGITYIGGQAVTRVTKESQELYKEWQKFIDKQPPEKKPPTNWEKPALGGLLGIQAWDSVKKLIDSVKDFFDELGAKEGENDYNTENKTSYFPYSDNFYYESSNVYDFSHRMYFGINDVRVYAGKPKQEVESNPSSGFACAVWVNGKNYYSQGNFGSNLLPLKVSIQIVSGWLTVTITTSRGTSYVINRDVRLDNSSQLPPKDDGKVINYYYENNTYQFTNNPNDIRQVYPNLNNLPDGKIVQITDPSGKTSTYYKGSFDDLFNDWVRSQDPNKLFGDKPVNATETDQGIKIGDDSSELPYPNPDPNPQPEPNPEGTAQGLGQIIQLLKDLINWSSKIFNKIPESKSGQTPTPEPEPETETLLEKLFKPDTKINLETDKLKKDRNLSLKFPFSIPWDLARVVKVFARSPSEPDLKIDIDTEYLKINHTIDLKMITLPIGFFRFAATAFFIFFLASKTRDLIKW
ncbi:hypothetical protein NE686_07730 [Tissierella carlieri]|uniref:Uncharacterized protein n=1 Tax=Tissierella carlieri TaxID=689904 RepID=A0ABT1S927_9FIRM|nr:hypothetical protein [Tissierella carlieri]MCQ4922968.1 hypothetical protein [Tissierella carlieri]